MSSPAPGAGPTSDPAKHDPAEFAGELAGQQASTDRRLRILLGAGASLAAGYPTLSVLGTAVQDRVRPTFGATVDEVFVGRNLEQALTRIRRVATLLEAGEVFAGLTAAGARDLETAVTGAIVEELGAVRPGANPYDGIAAWCLHSERRFPVELFTLNYDLSLEAALDDVGAPYFDGFSGLLRGKFRADLVDGVPGRQLPSFIIRLWKLHGSMNWVIEGPADDRSVVRGTTTSGAGTAAIYPSEEKYEASRRVPFVVLHDHFRRALDEPESLLIVAGYSFGDQHLNETIYNAALRNPRTSVIVFCHRSIPDELAEHALKTPNVTVAAYEEAIWGGRRAPWGLTDVPGVSREGQLELAEFPALSAHLARTASSTP